MKTLNKIFRLEAVLPIAIIIVGSMLFFTLLFDALLKKTIEKVGTSINGAEVNVGSLKTRFTDASIEIKGIEFTDSARPQYDSLYLDTIKFDASWSALFRAKLLIEDISVLGLDISKKRARPGFVLPPPPPPEPGKPSALTKEGLAMMNSFESSLKKGNEDNGIGFLAKSLENKDPGQNIQAMIDALPSAKLMKELDADIKEFEQLANKASKEMPTNKELESLKERIGKLKLPDMKNPAEIQKFANESQDLSKDINNTTSKISSLTKPLDEKLKAINAKVNLLDKTYKSDLASLKGSLSLPGVDLGQIAKSAGMNFLYKKFGKYIGMYKKVAGYLPPPENLKAAKSEKIEAHPRAKGMTYEFISEGSLPLFWVKKVAMSSNIQPNTFNGEITNITSSQKIINKPTAFKFQGDLPNSGVFGINAVGQLDLRQSPLITLDSSIAKAAVTEIQFLENPESNILLEKAAVASTIHLSFKEFKDLELTAKNSFQEAAFKTTSGNSNLQEALTATFGPVNAFSLAVDSQFGINKNSLEIKSDLGDLLSKNFGAFISGKLKEISQKASAAIEAELTKQKLAIKKQVDDKVTAEASKVLGPQANANNLNEILNQKVEESKKQGEKEAKKAVEENLKKAAEDLKKKLGF